MLASSSRLDILSKHVRSKSRLGATPHIASSLGRTRIVCIDASSYQDSSTVPEEQGGRSRIKHAAAMLRNRRGTAEARQAKVRARSSRDDLEHPIHRSMHASLADPSNMTLALFSDSNRALS